MARRSPFYPWYVLWQRPSTSRCKIEREGKSGAHAARPGVESVGGVATVCAVGSWEGSWCGDGEREEKVDWAAETGRVRDSVQLWTHTGETSVTSRRSFREDFTRRIIVLLYIVYT